MTTYDVNQLVLLDTNILVYAHNTDVPYHNQCSALRKQGFQGKIPVCICPQILNEFFAIITSPKRVTQPISTDQAVQEINKYLHAKEIIKIQPTPEATNITLSLLKKHQLKSQSIFDTYLVATMISNGINKICTYNARDFERFDSIKALSVEDLLNSEV